MLDSLAQYPRWLVILCLTIVTAAAVWILGKLLRWTLGILLVALVLGGGTLAIWTLFKR